MEERSGERRPYSGRFRWFHGFRRNFQARWKATTGEPFVIPPITAKAEVPFGVNEVRLSARQWLIACVILSAVIELLPWIWQRIERFDTPPDYRIPYQLSKDYWLYGRRLRRAAHQKKIFLVGDSVIWGEYVLPDGTLSRFLNHEARATDRFVNAGLNGLFPLAEEGLINNYAPSLRKEKVIVHCNLLWMTSPKADLSTTKEEQFNHSRLVPQFFPRIPCYRENANERLSAVIESKSAFLSWIEHLQDACFEQKSILRWTLQEDGADPPNYTNACKNPLRQISFQVPLAPAKDPLRGPDSPRHKPWSLTGEGTARFEWVALQDSLQWHAFQRMLRMLRARGNDVLIILGPFNEHIMAEENRSTYRKIRDEAVSWFSANHVRYLAPEPLPSPLYADASHPLTAGYAALAKSISQNQSFQSWCNAKK